MFPMAYIKQKCKKKLASTRWYNTCKYTAYVKKKKKKCKQWKCSLLGCVCVCNPVTVAGQAILFMESSRQEY